MSASDLQQQGLRPISPSIATPPAASASRRRPSTTRCTTPSASASSRPSTPNRTSTASSSRPIPRLQKSLGESLASICPPPPPATGRCRCRRSPMSSSSTAPLQINHLGQFPGGHDFVQHRARRFAGRRGRRDPAGGSGIGMPISFITDLPGRGAGLSVVPGQRAVPDPGRDRRPMYIVLGVLYESFIHPITILSTLPSAGIGALLALMLAGRRSRRHRASSASCC